MKLAAWLEENDRTDTWLAEQVDRDRSFITKIKNGEALPSVELAAEIQRVTEGKVTALDYARKVKAAIVAAPPSEARVA